MKVNILGTEYTIKKGNAIDYPKLKNSMGYCDTSIKTIVVSDMKEEKDDPDALENMDVFQQKVIRHEIVHAMLYESGLSVNSDYACNEEMVDWIAIQTPKMLKAFRDAGMKL